MKGRVKEITAWRHDVATWELERPSSEAREPSEAAHASSKTFGFEFYWAISSKVSARVSNPTRPIPRVVLGSSPVLVQPL